MREIRDVCAFLLISIFLFFVLATAGLGSESSPGKTPYRVPAVNSRVKVDGVLDEKAWEEALVLELRYEVDPGENIAAPVKTEVL